MSRTDYKIAELLGYKYIGTNSNGEPVYQHKQHNNIKLTKSKLKGVSVIYHYNKDTYEIIPHPAAVLCELAGTCKILKIFIS